MANILIDSDLLIDQIRGIPTTVAYIQQLQAAGEVLCTCDIVIAEFESGLSLAQSPSARVITNELVFLEQDAATARQAGRWRHEYARKGIALSTTDTAACRNCPRARCVDTHPQSEPLSDAGTHYSARTRQSSASFVTAPPQVLKPLGASDACNIHHNVAFTLRWYW